MPVTITMTTIGYIRSPYTEPSQMPGRGRIDPESTAELVIKDEYLEGIADIAPGERLMVFFYFHRSPGPLLTVRLRGVGPLRGVFSSHAPHRPNGIGLTTVTVTAVEGNTIRVRGIDMLDETPILDLKPALRPDEP